jgi:hypothetical protein
MKKYLVFLGALAAYGQTVSLSDTLTNAVGGGSFTGRITVTLNAPASAQPLYYSTTSLTGWQAVYCIGVTGADCTATTNAGTFSATLYANSTITPAGTSYAARFTPAKGSPWSETWVVTPSTTTLRQVRSTTVPTPTTTFGLGQLAAGGATAGQYLRYTGSAWAPATLSALTDPTTTTGDLIYRASGGTLSRLEIGSAGQVLTVAGGLPSWAAGGGGGGAVSSVFGRTGAVVAASGDYTTAQVTESGNLYYTDARARAAITGTAPVSVAAGVVSMAPAGAAANGYLTSTDWNVFNGKESALTVSAPLSRAVNAISCATCAVTSGSYADPAWITSLAGSKVSGAITGNAATATALAANPADCTSGQYATTIAANGDLTCAAVAYAQVSGTPTLAAIATSGSASDLTTGTVPTARLGTGTASSTTFLRGDGSWATPAGGGSGTVTSVGTTTSLFSVANPTTTPSIDVTGTSGGIPYFSTGTTLASSAALDAGALVVGGGAGAAPSILANSSTPNAGELRISTAPAASATRSVFGLGSAITGGNSAANGGTYYGLNAATGFIGDFLRFELAGSAAFSVNRLGTITVGTGNTYGSAGISVSNVGTLAIANSSTGASAALRITGAAGTGSGNFLALRGTSGGTATDQLRINGDQKAVMVGQTVATTGLASMSLYVGDTTATSGVTRLAIQEGPGQGSTNGFEYRLTSATANGGTLVWSISAGGEPTWGNTSEGTCSSTLRGQVVMVQGGSGVKDTFRICAKDAADAYAWRTIY